MKKIVSVGILLILCTLAEAKFHIDFSRVGYMWGDRSLPEYPVRMTLEAPADGSDMTAAIQKALDSVEAPGAVLLKEGLYNVSGALVIERNGVVLRGEGEGTVITATGTSRRTLITMGKRTKPVYSDRNAITDDFTPVGQMWVDVKTLASFAVGDRVAVCCVVNDKWISDLRMDQISQNVRGTVKQWKARHYTMRWERIILRIKGNRVWFDNPIVMELDKQYMSAYLEHVEWDRTIQSGIENIRLVSDYDKTIIEKRSFGIKGSMEYEADEEHSWSAIDIAAAEHCWVTNVTSANFAYCLVNMMRGAKNITVRECVSTHPVSQITGSRRDAFHITGGQLCLVERCRAEYDRHGLITGGKVAGPNVFLECEMVNAFTDAGPHQRWASGVLYDSCVTDNLLAVQDRAGWGTGHGWAGVSFVFWNCDAATLICQNPWVTGKNWCIGCSGIKKSGRNYLDGIVRPDGVWKSHGRKVSPGSLYRYQLSRRKTKIASDEMLLR